MPILKLIIAKLSQSTRPEDKTTLKYLQVVLNSTIHLQNVIEDALDITRLENNKFQLVKEMFNLRQAI